MLESSRESLILEPSSGEGVFIDALQAQGFNRIMAYEIDRSLIKHSCVKNESFVSVQPNFQFDAIIGNPPYVRWKNMLPESKVELNGNPIWRANILFAHKEAGPARCKSNSPLSCCGRRTITLAVIVNCAPTTRRNQNHPLHATLHAVVQSRKG